MIKIEISFIKDWQFDRSVKKLPIIVKLSADKEVKIAKEASCFLVYFLILRLSATSISVIKQPKILAIPLSLKLFFRYKP